jgi:ketosteroid isomerase-like protein
MSTAAQTSDQNLELVRELARRFTAGDGPGAAALFHPEIEVEQPASLPHGGRHRGAAGMAAMGAEFARHWERTITDPRISGDAATVVQLTTQTWTARETGRSATVDVVELFAFAGGLISGIRVFQQDTHALLATLDG